jgi:hypothetical protein
VGATVGYEFMMPQCNNSEIKEGALKPIPNRDVFKTALIDNNDATAE